MALTDTAIRKAKIKNKAYKLADGEGLFLLVTPAGGKLWRWKYRFDGKEKLMSFGKYPDVPLVDARERRNNARKKLATGDDPMAERKAERAALDETFSAVAWKWFDVWSVGKAPAHSARVKARMEADILPCIGSLSVREITTAQMTDMITAISDRGATDTARRALQSCKQIFRFAKVKVSIESNPASDMRPSDFLPSVTTKHFAHVGKAGLPALLCAIESYKGMPATRLAMKLMVLTFVRTKELIGAK